MAFEEEKFLAQTLDGVGYPWFAELLHRSGGLLF